MSGPFRLHPEDLAALADLVAERVTERVLARLGVAPDLGATASTPGAVDRGRERERGDVERERDRLVTAADVAGVIGVHRDTIYAHADRLGARRLGEGPRARLRFDLAEAVAAWTARAGGGESECMARRSAAPIRPRRRCSESGTALDSLPIRELQPRPLPTNRPGAAGTARGTAQGEMTP